MKVDKVVQPPEPMGAPGGMASGESPVGGVNALMEQILNAGPMATTPNRKVEANFRCRTFTLFRPWHVCPACKDAVFGEEGEADEQGNRERSAPTEILPEVGDRVCPHVNLEDYEKLVNEIYVKGWKYMPYENNVLSNGSVQVTMQWWETKETVAETRRRAKF